MCNFEGALYLVPLATLTPQRKDEELVICRAGRAADRKSIEYLQSELVALNQRPTKTKAPARDFSARVQNTPLAIRQTQYRERYSQLNKLKKSDVLAELRKLDRYVWPIPNVDVLRHVVLLREGYPADRECTSDVQFVTQAEFDKNVQAMNAKADLQRVSKTPCFTKGCASPYDRRTFHWCPKCDRTAICAACAGNDAKHAKFQLEHEQSCALVSWQKLQKLAARHIPVKNAKQTQPTAAGGRLDQIKMDHLWETLISVEEQARDQFDSGRKEPLRRSKNWQVGEEITDLIPCDQRRGVTPLGMRALINGGWLLNDEVDFYLRLHRPPEDTGIVIASTNMSAALRYGSHEAVDAFCQAKLVLFPVAMFAQHSGITTICIGWAWRCGQMTRQ